MNVQLRCDWINQRGTRCGLPEGHLCNHGNGLLTGRGDTPDMWYKYKAGQAMPTEIPLFSVKFSDPFAAAIIQLWCSMADSYKFKKPDGTIERVAKEKIQGAQQRLQDCRDWQLTYGTKVPD